MRGWWKAEEAAEGNLGVGETMYMIGLNGLVTPSANLTSWHRIGISGGGYHMLVHILPQAEKVTYDDYG